jgi:GxxExxY protein
MDENSIATSVVNCALEIHKELGPGLLESVYEVLLGDLLIQSGFRVERQKPIPIHFHGKRFDEGFRANLVVGGTVLVELKSVEFLARVDKKQVLTYLKLSHLKLGLLINFGREFLKGNIERLVNELDELRL